MGISEISSTAAMRVPLLSQYDSGAPAGTARERRAASETVPDSPNYSAAIQLNHYAEDISQLREGMSEAIQIIRAADSGVAGLRRILESMHALLNNADQSSEPALKALYALAYDELYAQLNLLASNSSHRDTDPFGESDPSSRRTPAQLPAREAALDEEAAAALLRDTRRQLAGSSLSLTRPSLRGLFQMLS